MTPTYPAPRVTTDRVARYIDAHRITDSGDSLACRIALDLLDARQQIAELEATIANERGEGAPPTTGWTWDGTAWLKAGLVVTRPPDNACRWEAQIDDDGAVDVVGERPTAREMMRFVDDGGAADLARGPT